MAKNVSRGRDAKATKPLPLGAITGGFSAKIDVHALDALTPEQAEAIWSGLRDVQIAARSIYKPTRP